MDNKDIQNVVVNTNKNFGRNIKPSASKFITISDSLSLRSDLYLGANCTTSITHLVVGFPVQFFLEWLVLAAFQD